MENQYFREFVLADVIAAQAAKAKNLIVIIIVPGELDEGSDPITEHGNALQFEFFKRLDAALGNNRLRVYSMKGRFIHSKLIMADDKTMSLGSANANRRGFQLDSELNVTIGDAETVKGFRKRLWAHNLGIPESTVNSWKDSNFFSKWDAVAQSNEKQIKGKSGGDCTKAMEPVNGECVIPFDYRAHPGKYSTLIPDVLASLDDWGQGTLNALA